MEKVTISFLDGSAIEADKNGDSYIVDREPVFPDNLSEIAVTGTDGTRTYHNAEVIECASADGRYWFAFREIPDSETAFERMDAQVLYTAIATDTLIED